MKAYIDFAILGLGAGALYAALSVGLVLTYKGAGVINLSFGAVATYVAYSYVGLRQGVLLIPPLLNPLAPIEGVGRWFGFHLHWWRWPTFVHLGGAVGTPAAFAISMVIAALLGSLMHLLVFRPLRNAPPLAKTVASVGVLLVLQSVVVLRFGTQGPSMPPILPSKVVHVLGASVPRDRLFMLAIAAGITIALIGVGRLSRLGKAIRAASENETGAMLIGLNPNRLAATTWIASSVLAGAVGILYGSISGIDPSSMVLFIVPALGGALVAGLDSFGLAAATSVLIGVVESITQLLQTRYSWFPQIGGADAIPLIVIVLAVVLRGKSLPTRGYTGRVRLPSAPEPGGRWRQMAFATLLVVLGALFLPFDFREGLVNSMVFMVIALSLVVVTGFAGQVSLFQMGLAGFTALLMVHLDQWLGIGFPLDGILAVIAAGLVGIVVGLPSMRVRGIELAILTLAVGYAFENMVLDNTHYLTSAEGSVGAIGSPSIFGLSLGINSRSPLPFGGKSAPNPLFVVFVLVVTLACCAAVLGIRRSDLGRRFLAVRSDERAAAGLGINVASTKLLAFSISTVLAGVGGALIAYQLQSVTASPYASLTSVSILALAYLGGISTVGGAALAGTMAVGGISYVILNRLTHMGQFQPLAAGLGLIIVAIINPEGISGVIQVAWQKVRTSRWLTRIRQVTLPEPATYRDANGSTSDPNVEVNHRCNQPEVAQRLAGQR